MRQKRLTRKQLEKQVQNLSSTTGRKYSVEGEKRRYSLLDKTEAENKYCVEDVLMKEISLHIQGIVYGYIVRGSQEVAGRIKVLEQKKVSKKHVFKKAGWSIGLLTALFVGNVIGVLLYLNY